MPRTVLYLSPSVTMYGARVMLLELATALDPLRYRPVVICLCEGELTDALRARGIKTYVVGIHPWRKGKTWPRIPINVWRLAQILYRERVDLMHCNDFWAMPWARATRWWAEMPCPIACHVRNPVGDARVRKYHLASADGIVTISKGLEDEFSMWSPEVRARKVHTIYDGIDFAALDAQAPERDVRAELGIPEEATVILQVGHISRRKDQATLLDALEKVGASHCAHLILAGGIKEHDRDFAGAVLARTGQGALGGRVHWVDFQQEIAPYYRACDILALPSREEGLGLVSVEAMHFGKPVVASRVGGIPEVVAEGETGLLHAPGDSDALAAALQSLLDDPPRALQLGKAAQARAHELFSLPRHVEEMQNFYDSLLAVPGVRG